MKISQKVLGGLLFFDSHCIRLSKINQGINYVIITTVGVVTTSMTTTTKALVMYTMSAINTESPMFMTLFILIYTMYGQYQKALGQL